MNRFGRQQTSLTFLLECLVYFLGYITHTYRSTAMQIRITALCCDRAPRNRACNRVTIQLARFHSHFTLSPGFGKPPLPRPSIGRGPRRHRTGWRVVRSPDRLTLTTSINTGAESIINWPRPGKYQFARNPHSVQGNKAGRYSDYIQYMAVCYHVLG